MNKTFMFVSVLCMALSFSSCDEAEDSRPVMMLRLRPTNTDTDESWNETFSIIKANPGCCDEVWFSTGMGYLPQDWHEDKVQRMARAMEQLKEIKVYINQLKKFLKKTAKWSLIKI